VSQAAGWDQLERRKWNWFGHRLRRDDTKQALHCQAIEAESDQRSPGKDHYSHF